MKEFIIFPLDTYDLIHSSINKRGLELTLINSEKAKERYNGKKSWNDLAYIKDWEKVIKYIKQLI